MDGVPNKPANGEAKTDYQMQLMVLEQENTRRLQLARQEQVDACGGTNHALRDYQMQLMLLEQQNKKRLTLARQEQDSNTIVFSDASVASLQTGSNHALQDVQMQIALLERETEAKIEIARQEVQDLQNIPEGPHGHNPRLMVARQEQLDLSSRPSVGILTDGTPDGAALRDLGSRMRLEALVAGKQDQTCDSRSSVNVRESDTISIDLEIQQLRASAHASNRSKYPAKDHAHKVKTELNVTSGLLYLVGQKEKTWEDTDGDMPFRQRRFAFYLSGANFPGTSVTYDIAKDFLILWVPVRAPSKELWYGAIPSIKECMANFQVDSVRDIKEIKAYLSKTLDPRSKPPTAYILHKDERPPPLDWESFSGPSLKPDTKLLLPAMARARAVKTPYEIAQIRKAVDISSQAHLEVLKHVKRLTNEAQVESIFLSKCRELGAKKQAYPPIAGSGPNAAVLHYGANDQDFGDRQLLVLDAGAEFNCYASDVTRTFPLSGTFTTEAKKIYQIVLNMQNECIDMIRPGQLWSQVSTKAVDVAMQGLLNIGILQTGRSGQTPSSAAVRLFFPHGLGHLVGLDTHDVILEVGVRSSAESLLGGMFGGKRQSWDSLNFKGEVAGAPYAPGLEEGMVITCEPGLYFNRAYIEDRLAKEADLVQYVNKALLEQYYPVGGCRLEDCVLVTKDGFENLTTAPKSHEMIKVINGET